MCHSFECLARFVCFLVRKEGGCWRVGLEGGPVGVGTTVIGGEGAWGSEKERLHSCEDWSGEPGPP